MFFIEYALLVISFRSLIESVQVNIHMTDSICNDHIHDRYHCLFIPAALSKKNFIQEIVPYCLTECPYAWSFENNDQQHTSYTFHQLAQKNITSQHLYLWSAPVDLIEKYQVYLDQLVHHSFDNPENLDASIFYNCTWPYFGSFCQYSFDLLSSVEDRSSLTEIVHDYYESHSYQPTTLTCYQEIKCYRGPVPLCLDWTDICDGKIDCLDGGEDEANCWKLEVNECDQNEYRCRNGQCIPRIFLRDRTELFECLDGFDEPHNIVRNRRNCETMEPIINCEDFICSNYDFFLRSSTSYNLCKQKNRQIMMGTLFSTRPSDVSNDCWMAILCRINMQLDSSMISCSDYCKNGRCTQIIQDKCQKSVFVLPTDPILFGHLHFAYTKAYLVDPKGKISPEFNCINNQFCHVIPMRNNSLQIENLTCHHTENLHYVTHFFLPGPWFDKIMTPAYNLFWSCAALPEHYYHFCRHFLHLYQCMNTSKCISRHRLLDKINDCFFGDDEQIDFVKKIIDLENDRDFFRCSSSNLFISQRLVGDGQCDCSLNSDKTCDDEYSDLLYSQNKISFQTMCDGFTELKPLVIDGKSMTDETDCESWPCDNVYNHCDRIWNCLDGRDEVECHFSLPINCSKDSRMCISYETNQLTCLAVKKVNDGYIDCVGATDERLLCRNIVDGKPRDQFHCKNDTKHPCTTFSMVCDNLKYCAHGDDELFCKHVNQQEVRKYFLEHLQYPQKQLIRYFSIVDKLTEQQLLHTSNSLSSTSMSNPKRNIPSSINRCHRGLSIRIGSQLSFMDNQTFVCFCPPSFYGENCQYQTQRISFTLQCRAFSDSWQIKFVIISFLIDHTDQKSIYSVQQFTYLPFRDCQKKFNFNLLSSTRTRNSSVNYSIHIDVYEHHSHFHRASYFIPILFPFLPVYRLALQLDIHPRSNDDSERQDRLCTDLECGKHGRCRYYDRVYQSLSYSIKSFCQCDQGWSGRFCTIPVTCSCSSRAVCLGKLINNNRSICLCPRDRFGSRCYLSNDYICQDESSEPKCFNGGQCIPNDEHQLVEISQPYTCICTKGFKGNRCEYQQTEIIISFHRNLVDHLSSSMLIHFIRSYPDRQHEYETTFKIIPYNHSSVSIYWPHQFHLIFIEFYQRRYYLAIVRPNLNRSEIMIEKMIQPSDRCPHVRELLSPILFHSHRLYRMKYYHLLCHSNRTMQISCFYDDDHLCMCHLSSDRDIKQEANCFEYDHQRKFNCLGKNACENGGQCFQDNPTCPSTSICMCPTCHFGRRCELTMDGFQLSLDIIIGYHIQPNVPLSQQPKLILVTFVLSVSMTVIGVVNGLLVLLTFKSKSARQVGCGYYFFGSAITTLSTMFLFLLKFLILLYVQMGMVINVSFILGQCRSIDYLLRICLNLDQWLNACVSLERAFTIIQGLNFNRDKSKQQAKWIIIGLLILVLISGIHDPVYRRLIDNKINGNDEEYRVWCIVSYPKWLRTLDSIINMIHFMIPFIINISSAAIIIWLSARQRLRIGRNLRLEQVLSEQIQQHKKILIGPLALVIMSIPRLIISITFRCMRSTTQSQLYLAGYLLSFVPVMLKSILIVFPSKPFRRELQHSFNGFGHLFRTAFYQVHRLLTLEPSR